MLPSLPEDLESFIRKQDAPTLAGVLLELAGEHEAVRRRLARLQLTEQPERLAQHFRKVLARWRRGATEDLDEDETRAFGHSLQGWVSQVERELLPRNPVAALELAEAFLECDAAFLERVDDPLDFVAQAFRAGCELWLRAAARCEAPASGWPYRLAQLASADPHGVRQELLRRAELLLDESALRCLVDQLEGQLAQQVAAHGSSAAPAAQVLRISADLSLLAQALRDPDLHVRTVLRYSPLPDPQQKQEFVQRYLQCDRAAQALPWLQQDWGGVDSMRQRLLAEVLERLGRLDESAPVRQGIFERSLGLEDLRAWLDVVPAASRADALETVRQIAKDHSEPVTTARLLLAIGDDRAAETALVAEAGRIRGSDDHWLVPLAQALEERARLLGATAVYRALLTSVLDRAYARAYHHGARYWFRLQAIAAQCPFLDLLQPHAEFEAELRRKHARKVAFWAYVNGFRPLPEDDDDPGLDGRV